jgi:hypothetical protein
LRIRIERDIAEFPQTILNRVGKTQIARRGRTQIIGRAGAGLGDDIETARGIRMAAVGADRTIDEVELNVVPRPPSGVVTA